MLFLSLENKILSLKNISKTFDGDTLFQSVSLDFEFGKIYALTAGNGQGKTTLFKIILGLISPDNGEVLLDGQPLNPIECAVAFQEHRLFPHLTAEGNVTAISGDPGLSRRLLSHFGFSEEDMKKKPRELSGGMKQMVSISRAVAAKRKILLLDEASKELDKSAKERFYALLDDIKKDSLTIMITHDSEDVDFCDETVSLENFLPGSQKRS